MNDSRDEFPVEPAYAELVALFTKSLGLGPGLTDSVERPRYAALTVEVGGSLNVDAGLHEALERGRYAALQRDIGALLDLNAGLLAATKSRDDEFDSYLAAAIQGDRAAINYVLRTIHPLVVRYCRARLGRTERTFASADDVAQEVCMAVLTALSTYRDQGRPFLAFVYGIASHKVIDAHRAAGRNKSEPVSDVPDSPEVGDGPEQHALQFEAAGEMNQLLALLPDKQRDILVLRVVNGFSAEETAEIMGSTPGAIRVAQHRALARLRKAKKESGANRGSYAANS